MIPKSKIQSTPPNYERFMLILFPLITLTMLTLAVIALGLAKTFIVPGL